MRQVENSQPLMQLQPEESPRTLLSAEEAALLGPSAGAERLETSAGERLERGLTHDQRLRRAEAELMQLRINSAHRAETRARSACVVLGLLPLLLLLVDSRMAAGGFGDETGWLARLVTQIFVATLGLVMWVLPGLAAAAVIAWLWRKHLLQTAGEQHLEVCDPSRIDYH